MIFSGLNFEGTASGLGQLGDGSRARVGHGPAEGSDQRQGDVRLIAGT